MASLIARRWVGFEITISMKEVSWGGCPLHISIGVARDRRLMSWANSAPVMPGMELSVRTKSCTAGSKRLSASLAEFTGSTSNPKWLRKIFVKRRVSTLSSTRRTVFDRVFKLLSTLIFCWPVQGVAAIVLPGFARL